MFLEPLTSSSRPPRSPPSSRAATRRWTASASRASWSSRRASRARLLFARAPRLERRARTGTRRCRRRLKYWSFSRMPCWRRRRLRWRAAAAGRRTSGSPTATATPTTTTSGGGGGGGGSFFGGDLFDRILAKGIDDAIDDDEDEAEDPIFWYRHPGIHQGAAGRDAREGRARGGGAGAQRTPAARAHGAHAVIPGSEGFRRRTIVIIFNQSRRICEVRCSRTCRCAGTGSGLRTCTRTRGYRASSVSTASRARRASRIPRSLPCACR